MKKIVKRIKQTVRKAGSLLLSDLLRSLAGLLGAQPELRPIPVRAERGKYRK